MALSLRRVVLSRLAARKRASAPLFGAYLLASALLVVLPETSYLSSSAAFQRLLDSLPPATSTVQVTTSGLDSDTAASTFEDGVRQAAGGPEHGYLRELGFRVNSRFFPLTSHNGAPIPTDQGSIVAFATHAGLRSHAVLVAGDWSGPPRSALVNVTLPDSMAAIFHAGPGDRLCIAVGTQADALCALVVGVWRPLDPLEAYWQGDAALPMEAEAARADVAAISSHTQTQLQAAVGLGLDLATIQGADPAAVQDALTAIRPAMGGNRVSQQVVTNLDTTVAAFAERSRIAGFALELITAQLWLIGLYCLLFLIGIRLELDRDAVAVWRTRGWPRRLIASVLSAELLIIAALALIPGAAAGFAAAIGVTRLVYPGAALSIEPSVRANTPLVVAGVLVMIAAAIILAVVAARAGVVRARVEASRPRARWWARPQAGLAAVLLAVPVLAESRVLADARIREAGGGLPYDLLLPGLGVALIAFAGTTLLPVAAIASARFARGLEMRLAGMQLARASGRQQRLSVLVATAIALGVLAAAYSGTTARNASDRAAYAAGADLRVSTYGQKPLDVEALPIPGAAATTAVFRGYSRPGSSSNEVPTLGVDPYSFPGVAWSRPGLLDPDLPTLMGRLAATEKGGTLLPAASTGLSIWVHGAQTGGSLTGSLTDAAMMPVTADFGSLDFSGWKQLTAAFAPAKFKPPLRLRHLTLTPVTTPGTVALSDLEAQAVGSSTTVYGFDAPQTGGLPFFEASAWWQSDGNTGSLLEGLLPDYRFPRASAASAHIFLSPGWLPVTINPRVSEISGNHIVSVPVPMLLSAGLADALHVKTGDPLAAEVDNFSVNGVVAGTFDYFPTLYGDAVVYSLPLLMQVLGGESHPHPFPTEEWVSGPASQLQADQPALAAVADVASIVTRYDLEQGYALDPLTAAGRANLLLGFAAACVLAIAAFAIYFAFAAASRTSENAILQANGLSVGQLRRSLLVEQLLVIAFSVVLGLAVGAALTVALLPGLTISTSLADTVPPSVLAINAWLAVAGVGITVVACAVAGLVVSGLARGRGVMAELRSLG